MHFIGFEIENYKGIKKAKLNLRQRGSRGNVFTLVGLNESGKTTLLEAITTFYPGREGLEAIYVDTTADNNIADRVPKNRKANFTDSIQVSAFLRMTSEDKEKIQAFCRTKLKIEIDPESLKDFRVDRINTFEDSSPKSQRNIWNVKYRVRKTKRERFKELPVDDRWQKIVAFIASDLIPKICYFPTFLFDLPERIFLANPPPEHETKANEYYIRIVQDVLDSLQDNLQLDKHIIDRVHRAHEQASASSSSLSKSDEMQQVDSVILRVSSQLTKVIFGQWNAIFGTEIRNKSIDVDWDIETTPTPGKLTISLRFSIRDGQSRFNVAERSLGFRWFFCFLLFTQFRVSRRDSNALFLFDEPASNLHSKAQEQLLKSFAAISTGENMTIYSTHSHYMIEPRWLEDTFIVSNDAVDPERSPSDEANDDIAITNIHVKRYRDFVGQEPDKMSYFQPILDKLDYAPSRLDPTQRGLLVEGKNDFYMLSYFREIVFSGLYSFRIIPSTGANDLGPLISLHLGWARPFVVLLDDDKAGTTAAKHYREEWLLSEKQVATIGQILPELAGRKLEGVLSDETRKLISDNKVVTPSKKEIGRFFQEHYAQRQLVAFDQLTVDRIKSLLDMSEQSLAHL